MAQNKINKTSLLYLTIFNTILHANMSFATDIDTNMARMQALDKITGRVNEIDIPVGGEAKFGSFSIVIRRCVTRSPEEAPENTAFVDIADTYNQETPQNIFKGWMFSSSPALNAVEHPIYDVWLLKCYNGDTSKFTILSSEELIQRDKLPMQKRDFVQIDNNISNTIVSSETPSELITDTSDKNIQNSQPISVVVDTTSAQPEKFEKNELVNNASLPEVEIEENGFDETEDEIIIIDNDTSAKE